MLYFFFLQQMSSFTADIKAKPEYHKFLIGRGGANIKKVNFQNKCFSSVWAVFLIFFFFFFF